MYCPKCGTPGEENIDRCAKCGEPFTENLIRQKPVGEILPLDKDSKKTVDGEHRGKGKKTQTLSSKDVLENVELTNIENKNKIAIKPINSKENKKKGCSRNIKTWVALSGFLGIILFVAIAYTTSRSLSSTPVPPTHTVESPTSEPTSTKPVFSINLTVENRSKSDVIVELVGPTTQKINALQGQTIPMQIPPGKYTWQVVVTNNTSCQTELLEMLSNSAITIIIEPNPNIPCGLQASQK